ncbi:hypothetical protein D9M73_253420 [compost metagenome]
MSRSEAWPATPSCCLPWSCNWFSSCLICSFSASLSLVTLVWLATTLPEISCRRPAASSLIRAKLSWVATSCCSISEICWKLHQARPAKAKNKAPTRAHNGPVLAALTLTAGGVRECTVVRVVFG